jgi:transcriptional regulator with XRE-family HTH domain
MATEMRATDTRAILARALRDRREELRLTQEQAAARCSVSVRYWRAVEAGRPAMRLEILERIVGGLGWSWHDLANLLVPNGVPGRIAPSDVHDQIDAIWRLGPGRERDALVALLGVLATKGRPARQSKIR